MKTLTVPMLAITIIAAAFTLGSQVQAHPEIGYQPRVVATPAQVTANTYEREISAEAGLVPRVQPTRAQPRFAGYEELNPKVGYLPPFFRDGRYLSDRNWIAPQLPRVTLDITAR